MTTFIRKNILCSYRLRFDLLITELLLLQGHGDVQAFPPRQGNSTRESPKKNGGRKYNEMAVKQKAPSSQHLGCIIDIIGR